MGARVDQGARGRTHGAKDVPKARVAVRAVRSSLTDVNIRVGKRTRSPGWRRESIYCAGVAAIGGGFPLHRAQRRSGVRQLRGLTARCVLLVVGSTISSFCYALTIRASLGLGPLYVAQDGLARRADIAIGTAVMVVGVVLIVVALFLRSSVGPGTLVLPFLSGGTLDAILPHVPVVHGLALRLGVVLVATWFMALGGAIVIRASMGAAAYDAVMLGLHRLLERPIAPIRAAMELSMLICGWLLGGAIGIGTVLTALLIGPAMQTWLKLLRYREHVPQRRPWAIRELGPSPSEA